MCEKACNNLDQLKLEAMCVSWHMEPAGSPVTVIDGGFSSPDAPRGIGGPKSKLNINISFRITKD